MFASIYQEGSGPKKVPQRHHVQRMDVYAYIYIYICICVYIYTYHIIPYHIIPYQIVSYNVISRHNHFLGGTQIELCPCTPNFSMGFPKRPYQLSQVGFDVVEDTNQFAFLTIQSPHDSHLPDAKLCPNIQLAAGQRAPMIPSDTSFSCCKFTPFHLLKPSCGHFVNADPGDRPNKLFWEMSLSIQTPPRAFAEFFFEILDFTVFLPVSTVFWCFRTPFQKKDVGSTQDASGDQFPPSVCASWGSPGCNSKEERRPAVARFSWMFKRESTKPRRFGVHEHKEKQETQKGKNFSRLW